MKIKISNNLYKLAKLFGKENPLFVVGGYVRNQIAKVHNSDIDLACNLKLNQVQELLKDTKYNFKVKNQKLGTAIISCGKHEYEYSTFRSEFYQGQGEHSPDVINFDASIVEDARRRDFTINAVYYNILADELEDFYGGINDIRAKQIRTVETADYVLQNDGVRILRMIRLACELNYFIDNDTLSAASKYIHNLDSISQDRLRNEFVKIINAKAVFGKWAKRNPSFSKNLAYNGIKLIDKLNAWQYFVKNNRNIIGDLQGVGAYLTTFFGAKDQDLLLSFCYDAYYYLTKYKKVLTVTEFCNCFLGKNGLNFKKQDYDYIKTAITNIQKALELDYMQKDKVKLFAITVLQKQNCAELRLIKSISLARYNVLTKHIKSAHKKHYPIVASDLKLDINKFYQQNPTFDKSKTKDLINKLHQAVILDKVSNSHNALLQYAGQITNKGAK